MQSVEHAVTRVEEAVKNRSSTAASIFYVLVIIYLWNLASDAWHSKWRYALANGVDSSKVTIQPHPHDCNFFAAPLGEKNCHYERVVSTVRWATSTTGDPIVSYDEGKTWGVFTPEANQKAPQYSTVQEVMITWDKKED